LETSSRINGFLSDLNAHYFLLDAQSNWNLGRFDPPFMVLSWRGFAGTTLASDGTIASDIIPVSMRFYIGGDADIRGFSRKELPFHGRGFYTALYNGIELRAGDVLPLGIQPFILLDVAKGGDESFHLAGELYWSPGFGVRWKSPFGVVRASLAHGFIENGAEEQDPEDEHWQFFASFGQEF
jgi:translocation and assembly module TamA